MDKHPADKNRIPKPGDSFTHEHPETHLERKDDRWGNHLRDWGVLLVMILVYLSWTVIIYLIEPGIR